MASKYTVNDLIAKASRSDISSIGGIVSRILEVTRNPNAHAHDLMNVISVDAPLCAKILKRANSAFFGLSRDVKTIQHAIVMLGFRTVKEIALSAKVSSVFERGTTLPGYNRKEMWKHSLATALTTQKLFMMEFKKSGEEVYPIALLHNIGTLIIEEYDPDNFEKVITSFNDTNDPIWKVEKSILGFGHNDVSAALLDKWNFPKEFVSAVKFHHRPYRFNLKESNIPLVLFASDYAAHCTGPKVLKYFDEGAMYKRALNDLNVSELSIQMIAEEVWEDVTKLEEKGELF